MTEPTDREMMRSLLTHLGTPQDGIEDFIDRCEHFARDAGLNSIGELRAEDFDAMVRQGANEVAAILAEQDQVDALHTDAHCPCKPRILAPLGVPLSQLRAHDWRIRHQPGCSRHLA